MESAVQQSVDRFGKIDILVNNAGSSIRNPFLELSVEDAAQTIDVCMRVCFIAVRSSQGT